MEEFTLDELNGARDENEAQEFTLDELNGERGQEEGFSLDELNGEETAGADGMRFAMDAQPLPLAETKQGEYAEKGNMGGITKAALQAQRESGIDAADDDGSMGGWLKNLWQGVAYNSSGKVSARNTEMNNQDILRGTVRKGGVEVPLTELPDDELDYLADAAGWNGLTGWFKRFFGGRSQDGIMQQWDKTEGKKFANEAERKAARVKYAQDIARMSAEQLEQSREAAGEELEGRDTQWQAGLTGGFITNGAYMLPYMVPGAHGILAGIIEGLDRYQELSTDKMARGEDGELKVAAERDTQGKALLKGAARGVIAPVIEMVGGELTGKLAAKGLGFVAKQTLGRVPLVRKLGEKVVESGAGKALSHWIKMMGKFGKATGINSMPVEMIEELEDQISDAALGLNQRDSELEGDMGERAADATRQFFQRESMKDLVESMLIVQVLGGSAAYAQEKKANRVLDRILQEETGVGADKLKGMTYEQKLGAFEKWAGKLDEKQLREKLGRGADAANELAEAMSSENGRFDQASLQDFKVEPKTFQLPTVETPEGNTTIDFKNMTTVNPETGETHQARKVVDAESGVEIIEHGIGDELPFTVRDAKTGETEDFYNLAAAKRFADRLIQKQQLYQETDKRKLEVINNALQNYGQGKFMVARTMEEALKESKALGMDVEAAEGFNSARKGWRLPDGTVVLVRDNIHTPREVERLLRHEGVGHSEEMMQQPWLDAGGEIGKLRKANLKKVEQAKGAELSDEEKARVLRESVANVVQKRAHDPSLGEKAAHAIRETLRGMGLKLKMSDADLEVEAAKIERAMREGEGAEVDFRPILQNATESYETPKAEEAQEAPENAPLGAPTVEEGASVTEAPQAQEAAPKAEIEQPTQEAKDEAGNGADEKPQAPVEGREGLQAAGEAAKPAEAAAPAGEAADAGVVKTPEQAREHSREHSTARTEETVGEELAEARKAIREVAKSGDEAGWDAAYKHIEELYGELQDLRRARLKGAPSDEVETIWHKNVDSASQDEKALAKLAAEELKSRGYKPNAKGYGWVAPSKETREHQGETGTRKAKVAKAAGRTVSYGNGQKGTLREMVESGMARLYPDKGLTVFDKGAPHVVTIGMEQFTPTKDELPALIEAQKKYDAEHPDEVPPSQRKAKEPSVKLKDEAAEKEAKDILDSLDFDTPELGETPAKGARVDFASPEFDNEKFGKLVAGVGKLVDVLTKSGHQDFKALATFIRERDAAKFERAKPVLQDVWNAVARARGLKRVSDAEADEVLGSGKETSPKAAEGVETSAKKEYNIGKEAKNGQSADDEHRRTGGVRAAGGDESESGGVLASGRVRQPASDKGVDGERSGVLPGRAQGVADKDAAQGASRQGNAGREAAEAAGAVDDRARPEGGERDDGGDSAADGHNADLRVEKRADKAAGETKVNPPRRDFTMTPAVEEAILEKGARNRIANNLKAIKLIRELKSRNYEATPEEQATLAKFVGWGGLRESIFNSDYERAYSLESDNEDGSHDYTIERNINRAKLGKAGYELYKELRATLNDQEYEAAKASSSTAFYTPITFVRMVHDALRELGVKGGRFLGPSAGTGNFVSAEGVYEKAANWQLVEKDLMTGEMLKALFPNQRVTVGGFEETKFPDGFFDFAIDNVPYADVPISDRSLSSRMFKIHDYFFAKTLAKLRPGGVMAFLTSTGTLDKSSPILRRFLTEHGGQIVGAVRLPNGFFAENAGTDVASDLVIVQKVEGRPDNSAFEKQEVYKTEQGEWSRKERKWTEKPVGYNGYFKANLGQVVGKMEVASGQFGPTLKYTMPKEGMWDKVQSAIRGAFAGVDKNTLLKSTTVATTEKPRVPVYDDEGLRQGNVTVKNGKVYVKSGEMLEETALPNNRGLSKELTKRGRTGKGIVQDMLKLRKAMRDVVDAQMEDKDDATLKAAQEALNAEYDAFVKKNGTLHDKWVAPFVMLDKADGNRMMALERIVKDKDGKRSIVKSDIFTKRVISRGQRATKAETPKEALIISYSENGNISVSRIAELLGVSEEEAVKQLKDGGDAFENPQTGRLEPSWEYLSGRVRAKLAAARAAVESGEEAYRANVEALEKVQPPMVKLEDTEIKFGATWVDPECMKDFLRDALGSESMRIVLNKNEVTGQWNVGFGGAMNDSPWGETSWGPKEFVSRVLNHETLEHKVKDPISKKEYIDERRTEANKLAADKLHQGFSQFIQSSEKWADKAYNRYNEVMTDFVPIVMPNNIMPYRAAGMSDAAINMMFEGGDLSKPKRGREYQSAVIARGVLGGNSLCLAHCVGAGKTLEMQSIGMLGRHLGMFKKPMYVVPNHMLDQFANEFMMAFPAANILKMNDEDVSPQNRRAFFAQVANGDWDAIVVKRSTFSKKLAMSAEYQKRHLQEQIADMAMVIESMKDGKDKISVDKANHIREKLRAQLEQLVNAENHDNQIVSFEELGVDQLFVDEAHNFKGMKIITRQGKAGGLSQNDSQQAADLQMKTEYVQSLHGGNRGVVFATGTPLSNAPVVEAYVILKYLAPKQLEEQGLKHFDDFVDAFGRITTESEFSYDGKTVREKDKVTAFVNIPDFMKLFRSVVDIVNSDQIDVPRPKPEYHMIDVDMTDAQKIIMENVARESAIPATKEWHNKAMDLTWVAKYACISPKMLGIDELGNKVMRAASEVKNIYDETAADRGTQLIFTDRYEDGYLEAARRVLGDQSDIIGRISFNLNKEIRDLLVAAGIPKEEIAIIQDIDKSKGDKDANKEALFAKVRAGEVRVLVGSRQKMGEGTNVQDRLAAIHLLHPGWKPAEDEQAIGRIIRFGNMYKKGKIFYYLTKGNQNIGSYETKNHQLIGVKSKLIDQVMHGDDTVREIDMDESAMDRDMLMGLASGNKALMELIDVKKAVHKLDLNTESTASSARRSKDRAEALKRRIESEREEFAKEQEGAKEWREKNEGKPFELTKEDGTKLEKVKDMAEYVAAQMTQELTKERYDRERRKILGNFNGVELVLTYDKYGTEKFQLAVPSLGVAREINYSGFLPDFTIGSMTAFKTRLLEAVSTEYAKKRESDFADQERQAKKIAQDAARFQQEFEAMRGKLVDLRKHQAQLEREVTPLIVQTVKDNSVAAYGNWFIERGKDGEYTAQRERDGMVLGAPTVKELIPLMDAEDFAHPGMGSMKTKDLAPRLKPDREGVPPSVRNIPAGEVDFDTPELYTGSAADYDKPSLHAVGTGEGSQVYGWGLYGSTVRGVAEEYARQGRNLNAATGEAEYKIGDRILDRKNDVVDSALSYLASERMQPKVAIEKIDKAIDGFRKQLQETQERLSWDGNNFRLQADAEELPTRIKHLEDVKKFLVRDGEKIRQVLPSEHLYEQTFFTNRAPGDESHLLKWYEPVSEEQFDWIEAQIEKEPFRDNIKYLLREGIKERRRTKNRRTGQQIYSAIAGSLNMEPSNGRKSAEQSASEFLARAGIDGVKYPVDSYGKTVKDGDKVGWNYVSFRDDNIRVDHKWRNGEMLFDTPELSPEEAEYAEAEDKTPTEKVMREVYGMTNDEIATALKAAEMEPPRHVRKTDEDMWKQAETLLSNPSYMAKLAHAVAKFPRPTRDYENLALNVLFRQRQDVVNAAQAKATAANEVMDGFEAVPKEERDAAYEVQRAQAAEKLRQANAELKQAKALMFEAGKAAMMGASEQGRALRSNRGLIDQHDYSYAGISGQIAKALGGVDKITPEMEAKIREIAADFARLDEKGRDFATVRLKAFAEKVFKQLKDGEKMRKLGESRTGNEAKRVTRNYMEAMAQIEVGAAETGGTLIGLTDQQYPAWGRWLKAIGEYHCYIDPEITEERLMEAIVEDISPFMDGVDANQVRDAMTGFGHNFRQSRYEAQRLLNDLRSQARLKRQLDYMNENNAMPPLTGLIRDEPSQTTRELQKEVQARKAEVPDAGRDERRLKGALESAKTRVKNRIADLERAIATGEQIPGAKRSVAEDMELNRLKKRKDELQKEYDAMFKTARGMTDAQRLAATEKALARALEQAMEDLARAQAGDFSKRAKRPAMESPTIDVLREKVKEVRESIRELKAAKYEFGMTPEEIAAYNARKMKNREKVIARLAERVATGDLRPQKKAQPPMDKQQQADYDEMGRQIKKAHQRLADMRLEAENATSPSFVRKNLVYVKFVTTAQRALRATMDFSAVLRQAARITMGHPVMGAKAFGKAWEAAKSDLNLTAVNDEIMADPTVREGVEKYGLHLREVDAENARDVEMFHGMERNRVKIFGKEFGITDIPYVGEFMLKSERHYITYLNAVSAELYSAIVNDKSRFPAGPTAWQKKMIADMINIWNGSAALSKETRHAMQKAWYNYIFWAPGLAISRVQSAVQYDVWHPLTAKGIQNDSGSFDVVSGEERRTMAKVALAEKIKSTLAMVAIGMLFKWLLWDDDDDYAFKEADIFEKFMMLTSPKAKNTTIDLTGGEASVMRTAHKIYKLATAGKVKTNSGRTVKKGDFNGPSIMGTIGRFVQGKLAPWASEVIAIFEGKDYVGAEYTPGKAIMNAVVPLTFEDIKDQIEQNGIGLSLLTAPLSLLGAGGSTYGRKPYENAVNRFLDAQKEYDAIERDELLDRQEREELLGNIRQDNPLMRDAVREDIAGRLAVVRRLENLAKKMERNGAPADESLAAEIEANRAKVLQLIRENR